MLLPAEKSWSSFTCDAGNAAMPTKRPSGVVASCVVLMDPV